MQDINPPSPEQLLAIGQRPLAKVEIWVDPDWINLCDLGGKNYVQDISISLGGASMTPQPVEGTWSATIFNKDGVFHPDNLDSLYKDYLKTERRVRISVGAVYGGVPMYWPRITGYMSEPKFTAPDMNVAISGGDYMKRLRETELRRPTNYWGAEKLYDSIDSEGRKGAELYDDVDAMNPADNGAGIYDDVAGWARTRCDFVSHNEGGGRFFVGKFNSTAWGSGVVNPAVCDDVDAGIEYMCTFDATRITGTGTAGVYVSQLVGGVPTPIPVYVSIDHDGWKTYGFYFIALVDGPLYMTLHALLSGEEYRIDNISIHTFTPYWDRYYELPGPATGPYYVTLDVTLDSGSDAVPCWQGEGDEDWKYEAAGEDGPDPPYHPPKIVYFNLNKTVPNGVDNLIIYYFTATPLEDVVARLLWYAGVCDPDTDEPYASENVAKTRMGEQEEYDATGVNVDMVWFEAGSNCLSAITKICERCDYRFYFKHDGSPIFRPKPTAGDALFTFTDPKHIATISTYQDQNEIKNRIVIKGLKQSDTVSKEESMPSYLTGEESDDPSIADYGERTLTINNHLFQDQDSIDDAVTGMCKILLDEYHEPKWYSDLEIPFNPIPLELGDNIQWEEMLSPTLDITQTGIIRDIKIDSFSVTYKCELT